MMPRDGDQMRDAVRDAESRGHDAQHDALRLWLRLFTCSLMIERIVRARLRARFRTTLPRFDLMAQLERNPRGLRMGELSERLMVTGGNVTGITDQLVREGLVERHRLPDDRRAYVVRLTPRGKRQFDTMAAAHETWIVELFGTVPAAERERLHAGLERLKRSVRDHDVPTLPPAKVRPAARMRRSMP